MRHTAEAGYDKRRVGCRIELTEIRPFSHGNMRVPYAIEARPRGIV